MIRRRDVITIAMAVFLLSGCYRGSSYQFEILVIGLDTTHPAFKFSKPFTASPWGKVNTVKLNQFLVVTKNRQGWDYKNPVWAFRREPGSYIAIEDIAYGSTPPGFEETVPAKALSLDLPYMAVAFGAGGAGAKKFQRVEKPRTSN